MATFGEKLRKLRKSYDWSQDQLGQKVGMHGRHIGKYEIGKAMPNAEAAVKLARVFEVSVDYLLRDDLAENPTPPISTLKDHESAIVLPRSSSATTLQSITAPLVKDSEGINV